MKLEVNPAGQDTVALSGSATLHHAPVLYEALAPLVEAPGTVTIDLSQVDDLDLAGLQVLLALVRERGRDRVVLSGCPAPIARMLDRLGLSSELSV